MKRLTVNLCTLFTGGLMLLSQSSSHASTLVYGLDFNSGLDNNTGLLLVNKGTGSSPISSIKGYVNYEEDGNTPLNDGGRTHRVTAGTFQIQNGTSGAPIAGLSLTEGFSVGFHAFTEAANNSNWGDIMTFSFGSTVFKIERNGSNSWSLYGDGGVNNKQIAFSTSHGSWNHIGLTFKGNELQVYKNGALEQTLTTNLAGSELTKITGGGTQQKNGVIMDNFCIYDGVLNANQFDYLSKNPMLRTLPVPEPSTAALGLLGIVSLMMRRRRVA